jgi:hypothetical protein
VTFNHGVEGSSPSALTMKNQVLRPEEGRDCFPEKCCWEADGKQDLLVAVLPRWLATLLYWTAAISETLCSSAIPDWADSPHRDSRKPAGESARCGLQCPGDRRLRIWRHASTPEMSPAPNETFFRP